MIGALLVEKRKNRLLAGGQQQQKKSLDSEVDLGPAAAGHSCEARVCPRAVAEFYAQNLGGKVDDAKVERRRTHPRGLLECFSVSRCELLNRRHLKHQLCCMRIVPL